MENGKARAVTSGSGQEAIEIKHLGDICKINGAEIEPVWCITGGSPCQDLSIAGKRAGLAGARSGLFMEQVRIVKEMRAEDKRNGRTGNMVRPRYLVWENVCGAYSSNGGRDFHAVLEEIARIAEPGFSLSGLPEKWKWTKAGAIDGDGWSIAWRTHDTKDWGKTIRDSRTGNVIRLGTPQRRRRISVVADFGGDTASEIQFDRKSVSGDITESREAGEGFAEAAESGAGRTGESIAHAYGETGVGYWQNGVQTLRAEGENRPSRPSNVVVCSTGNDQTIFAPTPINLMVATRCEALGRRTAFGVGKPGDPANTVSATHSHGVFATAIPINDKATRWQGGGESRNHDGGDYGGGSECLVARQNMVVRRLTPLECERLQGFPDGWTDIGEWTDEKGKKHKDADSPKYKALGNSIALPFWDWMLRRMARYLPEDATLGSLFDGIAGFPLIWERIHGKGTARWASEIEPFPIAVTKKHFPEEE